MNMQIDYLALSQELNKDDAFRIENRIIMNLTCLVSLFNGISTFVCHLMPRVSFKKNIRGTI